MPPAFDPIRIAIHYLCLTKLMHVQAVCVAHGCDAGAEETRAEDHRRQRVTPWHAAKFAVTRDAAAQL